MYVFTSVFAACLLPLLPQPVPPDRYKNAPTSKNVFCEKHSHAHTQTTENLTADTCFWQGDIQQLK